MLTLAALIFGVLLGYVSGGRSRRLAAIRFRWTWFVLFALVLQLLIFPLFSSRPLIPWLHEPLHYLSYALALVFVAANWRMIPLLVVAAGAALNLLALAVNGGKMPASVEALQAAGSDRIAAELLAQGSFGNVVRMSSATNLNALGDWLHLPGRIPGATAFSLGDLLISLGLAALVWWGMTRRA